MKLPDPHDTTKSTSQSILDTLQALREATMTKTLAPSRSNTRQDSTRTLTAKSDAQDKRRKQRAKYVVTRATINALALELGARAL